MIYEHNRLLDGKRLSSHAKYLRNESFVKNSKFAKLQLKKILKNIIKELSMQKDKFYSEAILERYKILSLIEKRIINLKETSKGSL